MKKVLILVMSSEKSYYKDLQVASFTTWDSEDIGAVDTYYYHGESESYECNSEAALRMEHLYHVVHLPVKEVLLSVSEKTKLAFEWALNKGWDYIMRPNASTYVDKQTLSDYIQDKPSTYFAGLIAPTENGGKFMWGVQYIISRDLVELSVKKQWDYSKMDDRALSLVLENECEFSQGRMLTLHAKENGYEYLSYEEGAGGGGFVKDLSELPKGHYAYRVKQDFDRSLDCKIMKELYESKHRNSTASAI